MLRTIHLRATLLALLAAPAAVLAADWTAYAGVGRGGSTELGLAHAIGEGLAVRALIGREHPGEMHRDIDGVDYTLRPGSTNSLGVLLDWYPMRDSGFRATAGMRYLSHSTETLHAASSPDGPLSGRINFSHTQPYLGIGWESAALGQAGWRFVTDVGLDFQHGGRAALSTTSGQDAVAERRRVDSELGGKRFRMGASIGVGYAF